MKCIDPLEKIARDLAILILQEPEVYRRPEVQKLVDDILLLTLMK